MRIVYVEPEGALANKIPDYYGQAAYGPNYGVGKGATPKMVVSPFTGTQIFIESPNWAHRGPTPVNSNKWRRSIDLPVALGPLQSPTYNLAQPAGLYHYKVDTANQYARWQVSNPSAPTPIPVQFQPAGSATLFGA